MRYAPLLLGAVLATPAAHAQPFDGPLSPTDRAAGWTELSGENLRDSWQVLGGNGFPTLVWSVEGDVLRCAPDGRSGTGWDLISTREFGDFELVFQFKTTAGANSGVKYRVQQTPGATQAFGPEYQVIDDTGAALGPTDEHSCGALYDIAPPAADKQLRPPGEWNQARIRVRDGVAQHWLNGTKVIEVPLSGAAWDAMIADSKFKDSKTFAAPHRGHLALQEHGGEVSYRNIRARDLDAPMPGEVALFDGKTLAGWTGFHPGAAGDAAVWSVADGLLLCKGTPTGYLRTLEDHTNFVLKVRWRFDPVTKQAGNSGVLLRVNGEDKVWPRSVEAQLESGAAGDFWNIGEFPMKTDDARRDGRNTRRTHDAERAIGEWNEYEIVVDHSRITLRVNGELLNEAREVLELPGKIALQSEGAPIQFRSVRLAPLP